MAEGVASRGIAWTGGGGGLPKTSLTLSTPRVYLHCPVLAKKHGPMVSPSKPQKGVFGDL